MPEVALDFGGLLFAWAFVQIGDGLTTRRADDHTPAFAGVRVVVPVDAALPEHLLHGVGRFAVHGIVGVLGAGRHANTVAVRVLLSPQEVVCDLPWVRNREGARIELRHRKRLPTLR